jgi:hypothetical protein
VNTWKAILATLVIFGAGVLTGGLLVSYSDRAAHNPSTKPVGAETQRVLSGSTNASAARDGKMPAALPVPLRKDFVERLDKELKLKPEQRERIEKIISTGQEQTKKIWQKIEPEMNGAMTETRDRIRCELSPEQQTQFEELLKQKAHNPQRTPSRDKSTNAPSTGVTNSASLDMDELLCLMFAMKHECVNSNATADSQTMLQISPKLLLQPLNEPGS